MSERYHETEVAEIESGRERQIDGALERLKTRYGFDVDEALKAGERGFSAAEVQERALDIADELEFEEGFFADDGCAMTLLAVAESSVTADGLGEERQAKEREMLMDVMFAIGAEHSPVVREMAQTDATLRERYFDDGERTEINREQMEFLDSHVDEELSAAVYEATKGEFLADVREKLGVTAETEQSYDVKVVKMAGSSYALEQFGVFGKRVEYPLPTEDYKDPEVIARAKQAAEWSDKMREAMEPYKMADKEYKERFGPEFGQFMAFFVPDTRTIYMLAEHAYAIVGDATLGGFERSEVNREDVVRDTAVIRHEYVHSQKIMTRGAQSQLGLAVEERRAELLSGDRQGYQVEKNFFIDLEFVTDYGMLRRLAEASKADDVYAAYLAAASSAIGMRTALLMMAATPPAYERNKETSKSFVDLGFLKKEGDDTTYDAIIGEAMERFGGGGFDMMMDNYVEMGGVQKLKDLYGMRKMVGYGRHRTDAMLKRINSSSA